MISDVTQQDYSRDSILALLSLGWGRNVREAERIVPKGAKSHFLLQKQEPFINHFRFT